MKCFRKAVWCMAQLKVLVVMGSDSDFPVMESCFKLLSKFEIPYEAKICSAHRSPYLASELASSAKEQGFGVIIAAAGGAAHLAGVVAAHTLLPVIGIPIENGAFKGLDALLSTVQMPGGIAVATVGVGSGGAMNAALLAAEMLALSDPALRERLASDRAARKAKVIQADEELQQ